MPLLKDIKNASLTGVSSNNLATRDIPKGGTIYDAYLYCVQPAGTPVTVANMKTEIQRIRLRIDGDLIIDATPTFLLDLQKYFGDREGAGNVDGVIPLHFASMILNNPASVALYALGTQNIDNITVEVQCGTLTTTARIELYTSRSDEKRNLGLHHRILAYPQNFNTTGEQEISTLPKTPTIAYESLHIEDAAGTIDSLTVTANAVDIVDEIPANVQQVILENTGRTPQTGYYHVTFNRLNASNEALPMAGVNDWRQKINWSVSPGGNFTIYTLETHGLQLSANGQTGQA